MVRPTCRLRAHGIAACASLFLWVAPARSSEAVSTADEIHWTVLGSDAIGLDWRGSAITVRYGLTPAYGDSMNARTPSPVPVSSSGPFREARITGLTPDTVYHYAIGSGADHTFRTAPGNAPTTFTFCVEADIGTSAYGPMGPNQALIAQRAPRFCLIAGDLSYADELGPAAVDQHFNDVMVWSTNVGYLPAWGNHEWQPARYKESLANYKGRFLLPNPRVSPGTPAKGGADWYWFDYGDVRFIAYPEPWPGALEAWFREAWGVADSAQRDPSIDAIVTFGHRPAYSTGDHPGAPRFQGMLDSMGRAFPKYVLNISGHSHGYERTVPIAGVTHVVAGMGGAGMDTQPGACSWASGCPPPTWLAFRAHHHGVLSLTVGAGRIEGTAFCGAATSKDDITCDSGAAFDHFEIPIGLARDRGTPLAARIEPNPARATSVIRFTTPGTGSLRVRLFDVSGRRVWTLADDPMAPAGEHTYTLGGASTLPSGVYLYEIRSGGQVGTGRLVLLK